MVLCVAARAQGQAAPAQDVPDAPAEAAPAEDAPAERAPSGTESADDAGATAPTEAPSEGAPSAQGTASDAESTEAVDAPRADAAVAAADAEPAEASPPAPEEHGTEPELTQLSDEATEPPPEPERVIEVTARTASRVNAVKRSPYAVSVVDLDQAKQRSADLGEVMARDTAITVQRSGGLGSQGTFALAGLGGNRLRFFLDGVPLDLMGYVAGIQNVPVNLVERVEVYQGVVPSRLGADALGGAVQLVTEESWRKSRASASYLFGDFGTHRIAADGRYVHDKTGLIVRAATFFDNADNDYKVDVSAYDAQGRTQAVTVPRFHSGYRAHGVNGSVGVAHKPWADRVMLTGFYSSFDNELQHGAQMLRPYGEVTFARQTFGVNAKHAISRGKGATRLETVAGYARLDSQFRDLSNCVYDWYGRCTPHTPATLRGEIVVNQPGSIDLRTDSLFLRTELSQRLTDDVVLRFALAPTYADRSGENRLRGEGYDPLARPRRLFTAVAGLELETAFFDGRVKNIAFVKGYGYVSRSDALTATGAWSDMSRTLFRAGGGDSVRVDLTPELYAKASYEYAMRNPSTDEVFGDGMLVSESLGLKPEFSHNANLGVNVDEWTTVAGAWRASLLGFARWSDDLIALLAEKEYLRYVNIWEARALGVEAALGWTVPKGGWLSLDGRLTYQDLRNLSSAGRTAAGKEGDRIPNIPYLTSSGSARLHGKNLIVSNDVASLSWDVRYVHAFPRGWESQATNATEKLTIPSQVTYGLALSYVLYGPKLRLGTTLEAQNLTDAKLFDFYGVQRPGRAFFAKWTLDY